MPSSAPLTSAPPTSVPSSAPLTSAPPTSVPSSAPLTSAPLTLAPTYVPRTPAPTLVPRTAVPRTFTPRTLTPLMSVVPAPQTTYVPTTNAPPLALPTEPEIVAETPVKSAQIAVAAAAPPFVSGASLASANIGAAAALLVLVSSGCYATHNQEFSMALSPLQLKVQGSTALGMILGNFLIMCICTVAAYAACRLLHVCKLKLMSANEKMMKRDARGWLRFPSAPLVVFTLLFQGTTLGTFLVLLDPPTTFALLVAIMSLTICVTVPLVVFSRILPSIPKSARYDMDRDLKGPVINFFLGPGEWVSVKREKHWANRFSSVIRPYSATVPWYGFVEYCASLSLSAMSATMVDNYPACGHIKLFSGLIFLVELIVIVTVQPYARLRDTLAFAVITFAEMVAMFLMSVGFYHGEATHWTHIAAAAFLLIALVVIGIKLLTDIICEVYLAIKDRRLRLQRLAFGGRLKSTVAPESDASENLLPKKSKSLHVVTEVDDFAAMSRKFVDTPLDSEAEDETGTNFTVLQEASSPASPEVGTASQREFSFSARGSTLHESSRLLNPSNSGIQQKHSRLSSTSSIAVSVDPIAASPPVSPTHRHFRRLSEHPALGRSLNKSTRQDPSSTFRRYFPSSPPAGFEVSPTLRGPSPVLAS
ncbi:hypothetical protein DIPPA_34246 [Diplonema papillatum]|nr:hypothetical protein DIPPA_34246 [Diplonema papillatum]